MYPKLHYVMKSERKKTVKAVFKGLIWGLLIVFGIVFGLGAFLWFALGLNSTPESVVQEETNEETQVTLKSYCIGPLVAEIPEDYSVKCIQKPFYDRIFASSDSENSEISIFAYPATIGVEQAIKELISIIDPTQDFGLFHRFQIYSGSQRYDNVMYSSLSDSGELLKGEIICFEDKGHTVCLFSYGRKDDYKSIRKMVDLVSITEEKKDLSDDEVKALIDKEIKALNRSPITIPIGGQTTYPNMYDGMIKDVDFSVNHPEKIIYQNYRLCKTQEEIESLPVVKTNSIITPHISREAFFNSIVQADKRGLRSCFRADQTLAPLLYWTALQYGYSFQDVFTTADNHIITVE